MCPGPAVSRLVAEGFVPYVAAYEGLPVEMMLEGKDVLLFRVEVRSSSRNLFWFWVWSGSCSLIVFSLMQSVPSHRTVHKEAETLLHFLQLPAFPPISRDSPLHPALLSLRYLRDANLPGNRPSSDAAVSLTDFVRPGWCACSRSATQPLEGSVLRSDFSTSSFLCLLLLVVQHCLPMISGGTAVFGSVS